MEYLRCFGDFAEIFLKIIIACLSGILVGMTQRTDFKPAAIKILILICLFTCLFMIIGLYLVWEYSEIYIIVSAIIIALALIAAAIIISKKGSKESIVISVSILIVGVIGMIIGAGFYFIGVIVTLITFSIFNYPVIFSGKKDNYSDSN
jgi:putative Mg2+ transporter-C (MgtC) family protein